MQTLIYAIVAIIAAIYLILTAAAPFMFYMHRRDTKKKLAILDEIANALMPGREQIVVNPELYEDDECPE